MDDKEKIAKEFPDFDLDTLPEIPPGFTCTAWHNDSCPTWHEDSLKELADKARPINDDDWGSDRQIEAENNFFSLAMLDANEKFESFTLKATTDEMIDEALRLNKDRSQHKIMIAVDFADESLRECEGGSRFNLHIETDPGNPDPIFDSNDWDDIVTVIAFARYVRYLGLGFHPDTRGSDYIEGDGTRTFTDAEAATYDAVVSKTHTVADPYVLGITIWEALGLV